MWDLGTFEPLGVAPLKQLSGGKLHVILSGKSCTVNGISCVYAMRSSGYSSVEGGHVAHLQKLDDTSALSGKSMKELAKGDRIWRSGSPENRAGRKSARLHR